MKAIQVNPSSKPLSFEDIKEEGWYEPNIYPSRRILFLEESEFKYVPVLAFHSNDGDGQVTRISDNHNWDHVENSFVRDHEFAITI